MLRYNDNTKTLDDLISNSEYVFFDIFDTLITRPFLSPKDLFFFIENQYCTPGFYKSRVVAEKKARESKEETTIDEIYQNIDPIYKKFQEIEENLEIELCYAIKHNFVKYKGSLSLGKKIFFVSDMYLKEETILAILNKNGYEANSDNLFLSSKYKKTKHTGSLYKLAIQTIGIQDPSSIVMFGDNKKSDADIPKSLGMKAFHYTPSQSNLEQNKLNTFIKKNIKNQNSLSPLLKIILEKQIDNKDYWYKIGYKIAGPIVYSYVRFIIGQANNSDSNPFLLFVGRDGYLLNKCLQRLDPSLAHQYIYAPRSIADQILKGYSQSIASTYKSYIFSKFDTRKKVFIVDSRTENFSAQRLIQEVLNKKVIGIYWDIIKTNNMHEIFDHIAYQNNDSKISVWRLFEYLITSPEPPIKAINKNLDIIYSKSPQEASRARDYENIENGCMSFINDLQKRFNKNLPLIFYSNITDYVNNFLSNPDKEDIQKFSTALIAADKNHVKYTPFLSCKFNIRKPLSSIKNISTCHWLTPCQIFLLNIFHPIQICFKRKKMEILFAPKLKNISISVRINLWKFYTTIGFGRIG